MSIPSYQELFEVDGEKFKKEKFVHMKSNSDDTGSSSEGSEDDTANAKKWGVCIICLNNPRIRAINLERRRQVENPDPVINYEYMSVNFHKDRLIQLIC